MRLFYALCLSLMMALAQPVMAEPPKPLEDKTEYPSAEEVLAYDVGQIVIGEEDAPVTVVEYFSLSCPHCAAFYKKGLPQLKKDFIDKGKVKLFIRHFPHNAPGLMAARLVRCQPKEQQHTFIETLLNMQDKWAFTNEYEDSLKTIAAVGGVDGDAFKECMANKGLEEMIIQEVQNAGGGLKVTGIPAFYVNGTPLVGSTDYESLKPLILEALEKQE